MEKGGNDIATDVKRILEDYCVAWNAHDVESIASFFTDDCIYEDVAFGVVNHGKDDLKAFLSNTFAGFPDLKLEWPAFFVAGDWAGFEWVMTGTHTGDWPGLPATGNSLSIRGASVIEMRGDKIKRHADYYNQASLLQQLGFMPSG